MNARERLRHVGFILLIAFLGFFCAFTLISMGEQNKISRETNQIKDHCLKEVGGCLVEWGVTYSGTEGQMGIKMSHLFTNCPDEVDLASSPDIGEFVKTHKGTEVSGTWCLLLKENPSSGGVEWSIEK